MRIVAILIFTFLTFTLKSSGQTEIFFPGKTLYWTNLKTPNYLDSLKALGFLTYKIKGVVHNKTFYREIAENDTLRKFRTTLDFYEYKIRWKHKGKKKFSKRQKGIFYFYYGHAAAIYYDRFFLRE